MFTKLEQRSWIKIEVARGRSTQECFQGLREACGDVALPYRTVARWVTARCHTAAAVRDLMRRWQWEILEHPPYSPDMSPCDYDLLSKVKEPLRGNRYNTREAIIHAVGRSIRSINRNGRADGVRRLPNIWQKVISNAGDYIEGV
ncbi:hypothetical protein C0J52_27943 [Blattella germanica]|nr:hypothetical protein C0J52_27943 [Blattella germanica]